MAQIVLISDMMVYGRSGASRYMGPYALASRLMNEGYSVAIVDYLSRLKDPIQYLENFIGAETLVVGISTTFFMPQPNPSESYLGREGVEDSYYTGDLWFTDELKFAAWTLRLKKLMTLSNPNSKLVLGGAKASRALVNPSTYRAFDFVSIGLSDDSLSRFVNQVANDLPVSMVLRNGIQLIDNRDIVTQKSVPTVNWKAFAIERAEALPIEVSRGCIYNCKFCHFDRKESTVKDLGALRDEFVRNYEEFGVTHYHFCDDCFNDSRRKVETICEMILTLPFKIEWISYARVDVNVKFPHTTELMVASGAKGLFYGLESFNFEVARKAGKGTPTEKVKEFLQEFKQKYGRQCFLQGSFIVGLPGETVESQRETIRWLNETQVLDFLAIGPLGVHPYSADLDKVALDYADYSRNPEKYGFSKMSFDPYHWEHETMNSETAAELSYSLCQEWLDAHHGPTFLRNIWQIPHFRSLGFSMEDIRSMATDSSKNQYWARIVEGRFALRLNRYWPRLVKNEKDRPQETTGVNLDSIKDPSIRPQSIGF